MVEGTSCHARVADLVEDGDTNKKFDDDMMFGITAGSVLSSETLPVTAFARSETSEQKYVPKTWMRRT